MEAECNVFNQSAYYKKISIQPKDDIQMNNGQIVSDATW